MVRTRSYFGGGGRSEGQSCLIFRMKMKIACQCLSLNESEAVNKIVVRSSYIIFPIGSLGLKITSLNHHFQVREAHHHILRRVRRGKSGD